jgi:hypothetical protein
VLQTDDVGQVLKLTENNIANLESARTMTMKVHVLPSLLVLHLELLLRIIYWTHFCYEFHV